MISVIMPAHNEAQNLSSAIKETVTTLENCGLGYEVVVIDDGSKDGTYEKALSIAKEQENIKTFGYKKNMGKGYALKYGFQFAQGNLVLFLDADLDLSPPPISIFLDYMRESGTDIVVGSKRHPLSKVGFPFSRRILSKGYSLLIKILFNVYITDTQVGIKLFRREVLEQVFPKVLVKRYAFDIELLANATRLGYTIAEAPIELKYHYDSGINLIAIWRILWDTMATFYRMKILRYYDRR